MLAYLEVPMPECRCNELRLLTGSEATEYARAHLQQLAIDNSAWEITLQCSLTGRRFLFDYPQSELHGGGPARLRPMADVGV